MLLIFAGNAYLLPKLASYGLNKLLGEIKGCELRFGKVSTSFIRQSLSVSDIGLFCEASGEEEIHVAKLELGAGGLWPGSPRVIIRSIDLTGAKLLWGGKYIGFESLLDLFSDDDNEPAGRSSAPILRGLRVMGAPEIDAARLFLFGAEYKLFNPYFTLSRTGEDAYTLHLTSERAVIVRDEVAAELGELDLSARLVDGDFRLVRGSVRRPGSLDYVELEPTKDPQRIAVKASLSKTLLQLIGAPVEDAAVVERAEIVGTTDSDPTVLNFDSAVDLTLVEGYPNVRGHVSAKENQLSAELSSTLLGHQIKASIRMASDGKLNGTLLLPPINLAGIEGPLSQLRFFGDDLQGELALSGSTSDPVLQGKLLQSSGSEFEVSYRADRGLRLNGRLLSGLLTADLTSEKGKEPRLRVEARAIKIEQLVENASRLGVQLPALTGVISGSYDVTGSLEQLPFVPGTLKLSELALSNGSDRVELQEELVLSVSLSGAVLKQANIKTRQGNLIVSGGVRNTGVAHAAVLDLRAKGKFPLASLIEEFPNIEQLDGEIDVALSATGSISAPLLNGQISLTDGRLVFPFGGTIVGFSGARGTFNLAGDRLSSTDLTADFAGARVTGTAKLESLFDRSKLSGGIELNFADVVSEPSPGLTVSLKGTLGLRTAPGEEVVAFGDVRMGRSGYSSSISLASILRSFQELLLPKRYADTFTTGKSGQTRSGPRLDLKITTDESFTIDTTVLKADLGGAVSIQGHFNEPLVSGKVSGKSGEFFLGKKKFVLYAAEAKFSGEPGINPQIRLVAETEVRSRDGDQVPAQLMISGRMDSPRVRILSSAGLSENELMSQLASSGSVNLFGSSQEQDPKSKLFGLVGVTTPLDVGARLSELIGLKDVQIGSALTVNGEVVPEVTAVRPLRDPLSLYLRSQFSREQESAANMMYSLSPDTSFLAGIRTNTPSRQAAVGSESMEAGFQRKRYFGGFGLLGWLDFDSNPMPYEGGKISQGEATQGEIKEIQLRSEGLPSDLYTRMKSELAQFKGATRTDNTMRAIKLALLKVARSENYLQASVEELDAGQMSGVINLSVLLRSKLKITFEGNTVFGADALLEPLKLDSRLVPLSVGSLHSLQLEIKALYQRFGYYFVTTTLEEGRSTEDELNYIVHINEGPSVSVVRVACTGNSVVESSVLEEQLVVKPRGNILFRAWAPGRVTDLMLERDRQTIRESYAAKGFFSAKVDSKVVPAGDSSSELEVQYIIDEQGRSIIQSIDIDFSGDQSVRERIVSELTAVQEKSEFDYAVLEKTKEHAATTLRGIFAFFGSEVRYDFDRVAGKLTWHIVTGERISVSKVEFIGNHNVDTALLQRELAFRSGDQLTEKKLEQSIQNLYESGLVSSVTIKPKEGGWTGGAKDIEVEIKEREGGIVSSSVTVNSEDGLHLNADLSQRNLFATGNTIRFRADTYTKGDRSVIDAGNLGMSFGVPHVDSHRGKLTFDLFADYSILLIRPYSYNKVGGRINYDLPISSKTRLRINLQEYTERLFDVPEDIEISENDTGSNFFGGVGAELDVDNRNDRFVPTKGNRLLLSANLFSQALGSSVNFTQLLIKDGLYVPTTRQTFLYFGAAARLAEPFGGDDTIPLSHRYFLGGRDSLRGFSRNAVGPRGELGDIAGGDTAFNASAEYHYRVTESFETLLFVDVGQSYLRNEGTFEGDNENFTHPRYSPGIGFRFITPVGPLGIEYGVNPEQMNGERPGRVYFGLGGSF